LYLVAGCTNLRNKSPEKNIYRVQAQSAMAAANRPATGEGLRVQRFSIAPEFETSSFVYQLSPTRFTTDFYNSFMVPPARMITEIIQEDLWASTLFSPVPDQTLADVHFQLVGKILAFHGDIQDTQQPKAVVTIRLNLEKNTGSSFTSILHKTYGAQIVVDAQDPGALAEGLGRGINKILDAFYTDIEKTGLTIK
jgi:uncharacterized lipoprotein YmbA